jgi:hypothetical protein
MRDVETRLRHLELRPRPDLRARVLAGAATPTRRPLGAAALAAVAVAVLIAAYVAIAVTNAPPASAASTSGYGVGAGCWLIKDANGVRPHLGGWYHGLPALCVSERR